MKKAMVILLAMILCGCQNAKDIDERNFVLSGGMDKGENKNISFTAGCALPDTSGNATVKSLVLNKEADSVASAMEQSGEKDTRSIYFGHLKAVVIGRDFFEGDNIYTLLDYMERENDIGLKTAMLYTEGTARQCIEDTSAMDEGNNLYIWDYYKNSDEKEGVAMRADFDDVTKGISINDTFFIPRITTEDGKAIIGGGCVIKNGEYVMALTKDETRGQIFVGEKCKGEIIECEIDGQTVSAEVLKENCSIKFWEEDGLNCIFEIDIKAEIKENHKNFRAEEIAEKMSREVEGDIERLYCLLKAKNTDAFYLCDELRKENEVLYEKYGRENSFEKMNIQTKCDFNIISGGLKK
ncbi:MAG: Ger(x)C family spore germination protein [Firmicutes bacterium]|nr:Ger(x)C family spore germination protein [Bacillota bacterium]